MKKLLLLALLIPCIARAGTVTIGSGSGAGSVVIQGANSSSGGVSSSSGGIVSPGTFTWTNNFGIALSTANIGTLTTPGVGGAGGNFSLISGTNWGNPYFGDSYGGFFETKGGQSSATASYGVAGHNGANGKPAYGGYFYSDGSGGPVNYGLYSSATGGTNNYGLLVAAGQVQINSSMTVVGTSTFQQGVISSTGIFSSTVTVNSLSFSGGGNAQFSNDGINYNQIVGSSATVTVGHSAIFSSSWQVVDGGVSGGGGGTPSSPNYSVQVDSNGAFGGSSNFTSDGTSVTISNVSSMTVTNVSTFTVSGAQIDFSQSNGMLLSSGTLTGYWQMATKTAAQIKSLTPVAAAQYYYCSDCSTVSACVSTGTVVGSWALITSKTSTCQ